MDNKKIIIIAAIAVLVFGTAGWFGGLKYGQKKSIGVNFRAGAQGQFSQDGKAGYIGRRANGQGFVNGQIIAQDEKSITVKSRDGGSKLILLSESTEIAKSATGTADDLTKDVMVIANGTTNPDGSITATNIQIHQPGEGFGIPGGGNGPQGPGPMETDKQNNPAASN